MPSFKFEIPADEEFALDFAAQVHKTLTDAFHQRSDAQGLSKSDVAKTLGMSKSRVSRILSAEPHNPTIETVGRICWALSKRPRLVLEDISRLRVFESTVNANVNLAPYTDNTGSSTPSNKTIGLRIVDPY